MADGVSAKVAGAVSGQGHSQIIWPQTLVEALAGLLIEPERRRALGQRARAWAEEHLGWERGAEAFEELYDRLTAGTPQPPMSRSASGR